MVSVGDYQLIRELGRGFTGVVYLAQQKSTRKLVSIKIIRIPQGSRRRSVLIKTQKEAEIPRLVSKAPRCHKNIACILDFFKHQNTAYIVSEYVRNSINLSEWLARSNWDPLVHLDIMYQLAEGLSVLHEAGIAHRDIKSENIIMKGDIPIIIDFDISCLVNSVKFQCRGIFGTPLYLAPEYLLSRPHEDIDYLKADIYSLGVVYFLLANGYFPYSAKNREYLFQQVRVQNYLPSQSGILHLDQLIMKMLGPPEERPYLVTIKYVLQDIFKSYL